jgi:hypothetical protein
MTKRAATAMPMKLGEDMEAAPGTPVLDDDDEEEDELVELVLDVVPVVV